MVNRLTDLQEEIALNIGIQGVRARCTQKYMLMFLYLKALWNLCFQQCTE